MSLSIATTRSLAAPFLPFMAEGVEPEIKSLPPPPLIKKKRGGGRKPTVQKNTLKPYLQAFHAPGFILAAFPELNSLITGTVYLDMGNNTRPLSKKIVVSMLSKFDVISSTAVKDYMELILGPIEIRQAQNIAFCLRLILIAAAKLPFPQPIEVNYDIDPCGNPHCTICASTAADIHSGEADEENMEDFAVEMDDLNLRNLYKGPTVR